MPTRRRKIEVHRLTIAGLASCNEYAAFLSQLRGRVATLKDSVARQRQADARRTPSLPARRSFPQARMSHDGTADFSGPNAEAAAYPST